MATFHPDTALKDCRKLDLQLGKGCSCCLPAAKTAFACQEHGLHSLGFRLEFTISCLPSCRAHIQLCVRFDKREEIPLPHLMSFVALRKIFFGGFLPILSILVLYFPPCYFPRDVNPCRVLADLPDPLSPLSPAQLEVIRVHLLHPIQRNIYKIRTTSPHLELLPPNLDA